MNIPEQILDMLAKWTACPICGEPVYIEGRTEHVVCRLQQAAQEQP